MSPLPHDSTCAMLLTTLRTGTPRSLCTFRGFGVAVIVSFFILASTLGHTQESRSKIGDQLSAAEKSLVSQLGELRVGTVAGAPLLNDVDDAGHHVGIASDFTVLIAQQLGLEIIPKSYPTVALMLDAIQRDEINIIAYLVVTEERAQSLSFTTPYINVPWVVIGRDTNSLLWRFDDLYGGTISIREKHPLIPLLQREHPEIKLYQTPKAHQAVEAVADGKADATVDISLYAKRMLSQNQNYDGKLHILGELSDAPSDVAFAVAPRNADIIPILNKALASADDEYLGRVTQRWIAVDFEPERRIRRYFNALIPFLLLLGMLLLFMTFWNRSIAKEVNRRKQAEQQLIDMTENLNTCVFQFHKDDDNNLFLDFTNKSVREMSRLTTADGDPEETSFEAGLMPFFNYVDEDDYEKVLSSFNKSILTNDNIRETFRFDFPSGEKGWVLMTADCRADTDLGRVWSGHVFDLTSERLLNVELDALVRSRDEYIAMISHEVRTPVQNIGLGLRCIDEADLTDSQFEMLAIAKSSADHLEAIVNDVLADTTVDSSSTIPKKEVLNLPEVIATVCRGFVASAHQKNLSFAYTIDESIGNSMYVDGLRLRQVLYNLIGNAVKYTSRGAIAVTTTKEIVNEQQFVRIVVADTGIGISKEQQSRIFEPYATVGAKSKESSGLGLALSDRFVAVMGGTLSVKSLINRGSEFTLLLPLISADKADESIVSTSRTPQHWHIETNKILVADDNELVRKTFAASLASSDYSVVQASNGLEALQLVKKTQFLAVITDLQMPQMNGFELAYSVLNWHEHRESRPMLILITGALSREITSRAAELFDGILFKPVKVGMIEECIDNIVSQTEAEWRRIKQVSS